MRRRLVEQNTMESVVLNIRRVTKFMDSVQTLMPDMTNVEFVTRHDNSS